MRILMLTHNILGIGGNSIRAHSLGMGLVELGHEVTLLAGRIEPGWRVVDENLRGVRVIQMPDLLPQRIRHSGLSPLDLLGRLTHVLRIQYDLIHGFDHRPCASLPAFVGRRWQGIPYVADWADLWGWGGIADERGRLSQITLGAFDQAWEQHAHRRANAVTVITTTLANRAQQLGIPAEKIRLVQVGANITDITPLPKEAMRAKYGLPINGPIVIHSGFAPYDAELLAETFVALTQLNSRVILVMTGGRLPRFEALVAAAGVANRVKHFGVLPYASVAEIMACGDVMVLPYTHRSLNLARFPNRFGDYLAAGRPIVTNLTGDMGQTVKDEGVGLVADENPEAFAAAIQSLLINPTLRDALGRHARHLAETRYSWRAMAEIVVELYQRLLAG